MNERAAAAVSSGWGAALPGVRRILVLRPNALGDFVFALPALHALRGAYPAAQIMLLGLDWHRQFLRARPGPVDAVLALPPCPGIGAPTDADPAPVRRLQRVLRAWRPDLALQLYGGGRYSNPFIASLGAGLTVGAAAADAAPLDRTIPYSRHANRRLELLQIAALAGAQPRLLPRELALTRADRAQAARALPAEPGEKLVVLHPGASDPRRRWPPERFAAVAAALAAHGARIVISATDGEAELVRDLLARLPGSARRQVADLTGRLPLPALCGLLVRSRMIIANDTGPLHLALALGTPAVGVFWLTNMIESWPLAQHLLRPAVAARVHCPVCGAENRATRCPHDASFVDDVDSDTVTALALELWCGAGG